MNKRKTQKNRRGITQLARSKIFIKSSGCGAWVLEQGFRAKIIGAQSLPLRNPTCGCDRRYMIAGGFSTHPSKKLTVPMLLGKKTVLYRKKCPRGIQENTSASNAKSLTKSSTACRGRAKIYRRLAGRVVDRHESDNGS